MPSLDALAGVGYRQHRMKMWLLQELAFIVAPLVPRPNVLDKGKAGGRANIGTLPLPRLRLPRATVSFVP
jgi:hypothetical protein